MDTSKNIVKAGSSDDLAMIIDKIITKDASTIFLMVSEDANIAQNVLNFQLIKRESESVEKNVVVVTDSDRVQGLASKAALRVRSDVENIMHSAQRDSSGTRPLPYSREVSDIIPASKTRGEASDVIDLRKERSQSVGPEEKDHTESTEEDPQMPSGDEVEVPVWRRGDEEKEPETQSTEPEVKEEDFEEEPESVIEEPEPATEEDSGESVKEQEDVPEDLKVSTYVPKSEEDKEDVSIEEEFATETFEEDFEKEDSPYKVSPEAEEKQDSIERMFAPDSRKEEKLGKKGKLRKKDKPKKEDSALKKALVFLFVKHKIYAIAILAGVLLLGGAGYAATSVLPKASIMLNPHSLQDSMSFQVAADSNINSPNFENSVIPAQIVAEEREETFSFDATGSAQLQEHATGRVTLYNEYSSAPQTLVANTRLVSASGELFRTLETVVIPGADISGGRIEPSSVAVDVRADEPGEDYNIGSTSFSIPGFSGTDRYTAFYGRSEESMEGGYLGVATIVTQEDFDNAIREIEEEYLASLAESLRDNTPESLIAVEDSLDTVYSLEEVSANVGDPAEEFAIRVNAEARIFLITEEHINEAIENYFFNSTQYNSDFELSDNRHIEYTVREMDYERGIAQISVDVEQIFNRTVDVNLLVEEVAGQDEVEVRRILSRKEELDRAQVRFWPFWVRSVPEDRERIEVDVEYLLELELGE